MNFSSTCGIDPGSNLLKCKSPQSEKCLKIEKVEQIGLPSKSSSEGNSVSWWATWIWSFGPEYCFVSWALCFAVCCSEKGMNWWHVSIVILYVIFSLIFMEKCNIFAPLFSQHTLFSRTNGNLSNSVIFLGQKRKLKKITLSINLLCTFLLLLYFVIKTKY